MNHETQESAHSQIHFLRAKLSYLNTCSNMLLNLKGAFAAYWSWVNPSPEKYRVELWVLQGKFLPARLLCPTLLNLLIFFSEFGAFNWSILIKSGAWPLFHGPLWKQDLHSLPWFSTKVDTVGSYWMDIPFPWEDAALGESPHRTCSCWKQRLPCTWSPGPLHQPVHSAGHAAHSDRGI